MSKQSIAAQMWESFIETGKYPHLKQCEEKSKKLTKAMKERLSNSESKRHEFARYGLVGRFYAKKIYDVDYVSMNEYLYDLGILTHVVEIDEKKLAQENILIYDLIQDFRLPAEFYLKPSFNKKARALWDTSHFEITEQWSIHDMARSLAILKPQIKNYTMEFNRLKNQIMSLQEIQQKLQLPKERRRIKHKYGSLSLVEKSPKYNISQIYNYLGEAVLIEYGKPNTKKLEKFILQGLISPKELEKFKTLKDIRLDFSVLSLEDEAKIFQILDEKVKIAAKNRLA